MLGSGPVWGGNPSTSARQPSTRLAIRKTVPGPYHLFTPRILRWLFAFYELLLPRNHVVFQAPPCLLFPASSPSRDFDRGLQLWRVTRDAGRWRRMLEASLFDPDQ